MPALRIAPAGEAQGGQIFFIELHQAPCLRGGGAHQGEGLEGALVDELEAGLVSARGGDCEFPF